MNNEELRDRAKKVASDATGAVLESVDKARKFVNRTFTEQNIASAKKVVREELESLKTAEGRGNAKRIIIATMVSLKSRVVEMWQSGIKGKGVLIAVGVIILFILKSCMFSGGQNTIVPLAERSSDTVLRGIIRCKYCFHVKLDTQWEQPPACLKGHGHAYESIGTQGSRHFGCTKCGRDYFLQYEPRGYIHCPRGGACRWQEL